MQCIQDFDEDMGQKCVLISFEALSVQLLSGRQGLQIRAELVLAFNLSMLSGSFSLPGVITLMVLANQAKYLESLSTHEKTIEWQMLLRSAVLQVRENVFYARYVRFTDMLTLTEEQRAQHNNEVTQMEIAQEIAQDTKPSVRYSTI